MRTAVAICIFAIAVIAAPDLAQYRNLGKAFYENPTTQKQAVEQFRKALALAPDSSRERLNYALALLRAGDPSAAIADLQKVQKQDPSLPHTWFNLGIAYKKQGDLEKALDQFQHMLRLTPDEPVVHYQVGTILKMKGDTAGATREIERARDLNPRLAAPHFQLYGLYRQAGRPDDAARELAAFQQLKKDQEGAAVPEDMEWCNYAEIYDPQPGHPEPALQPTYREEKLPGKFRGAVLLQNDLLAWSSDRVVLFARGKTPVANTGLEPLRDVISIAPGDFDNDGLPDLCILTNTGAVLYRNENGRFRKHADLAAGSFRKAVWLDYDHDYDADLILLGKDSRLIRNNGAAGFTDETKRFPFISAEAVDATRADVDPDSIALDLAVSYAGRDPVLYRDRLGGRYEATPVEHFPTAAAVPERTRARVTPDGDLYLGRDTTPGNWIEIALTGVKNPKLALDARIEVKAGALYQRVIYTGNPVLFHLGQHSSVDTVRITWPNGLIQNEISQPVNRVLTIKEAPRLSGSCPMIFTWTGDRFDFITDVLGVAPLGASSGDGTYFPVDHDEYVLIPGNKLRPRDGHYEIRVTEELHEVSYIDQLKLIAVDHPANTEIATNEKFKSPPYPDFRLFGIDRKIYPNQRPTAFHRDAAGVAEMHKLDLDFGTVAPENRAILVLHGWVDWPDGSTFLAAAQAHQDLVFPYLQVRDAAGKWTTVIDDMGIPSGKPKTMVVDLTGKFLSASREIRIVTNLCVYWDEIYLVPDNAAPVVRMTAVPLHTADLHFRGFSKPTIHPERTQPEMFDYESVSFTSMWNPTRGNYTGYGSVADLVQTPDDRMVVMGSGDEIALRFTANLPNLPAGWSRDYLLLVDGWAKDADANTAFSQTVLPLPFHAMKQYGDSFPKPEFIDKTLVRPALNLLRPLAAN